MDNNQNQNPNNQAPAAGQAPAQAPAQPAAPQAPAQPQQPATPQAPTPAPVVEAPQDQAPAAGQTPPQPAATPATAQPQQPAAPQAPAAAGQAAASNMNVVTGTAVTDLGQGAAAPQPEPEPEAEAAEGEEGEKKKEDEGIDQNQGAKGAGKYQVKVIGNKCIGAASCVAVAPKAFRLNDQQIAEILDTVAEENDENLLLAAQSCPVMAIEVVDTETGEKVWPK